MGKKEAETRDKATPNLASYGKYNTEDALRAKERRRQEIKHFSISPVVVRQRKLSHFIVTCGFNKCRCKFDVH